MVNQPKHAQGETEQVPAVQQEEPAADHQQQAETPPNPSAQQQQPAETSRQQAPTEPQPKKKMKKRTKIIIWSSIAVAIVAIIAISVSCYSSYTAQKQAEEKQAQANSYYSTASSFGTAAITSGVTMETIGNEISSQWKDYVNSRDKSGSLDDYISTALSNQASNVTAVKNNDSNIYSMYTTLMKVPDSSNSKMNDIKTEADKLYSDYEDMYQCTTNPTGNYTSWTSSFSNYDSALSKEYSKYMAILK